MAKKLTKDALMEDMKNLRLHLVVTKVMVFSSILLVVKNEEPIPMLDLVKLR